MQHNPRQYASSMIIEQDGELYILRLNNYEMSFCELSWIMSNLGKWSCTTLLTNNQVEKIFFWNWLPTMFSKLSWSMMSIYHCICISGIITSWCSMIDHSSLQLCMIDQIEKDSDQKDMKDRNWPQFLWGVYKLQLLAGSTKKLPRKIVNAAYSKAVLMIGHKISWPKVLSH